MLLSILACALIALATPNLQAGNPEDIPFSTRFKGEGTFHAVVKKAQDEKWAELPIGERMVKFGRELRGKPYVSFSLEIDDHIEAPSANMDGLDCWSFFEIALGLSRMISLEKSSYVPQDLLDQIEFTRYRAGSCSGNYLERIHYLGEWFFENEARGVADNITQDFDFAQKIEDRELHEMTNLAKHYRYLRENPALVPKMAVLQDQLEQLPVYYVPKDKVKDIEDDLQNGDIIGIATK
ncbi:MAG: N-acetylmuramoyl-L-alanine amidase-like domain-containing protein, partial [Verrucomicrobiota bacterium]